jgi:hypothetical protein
MHIGIKSGGMIAIKVQVRKVARRPSTAIPPPAAQINLGE